LRALLAEGNHEEVHHVVVRAYQARRTTKRVAALFGCAPTEWARFMRAYPRLREARARALRQADQVVRAVRQPSTGTSGLVRSQRVVSEPGAIIEVIEVELSDEGHRALTTGTPRLGKVK